MPDRLFTPSSSAGTARDVDEACRGIGEPRALAGATRVGTGDAVRANVPADAPVERPVVREAVRRAAVEAVTHRAHERVVELPALGSADDRTVREGTFEEPSPELVRLLAHLRSAVTRYTHERRDAGAPVERVVPEVKGLVREATACERWCDPADTLTAQVVRWAIAAYYDDPEMVHAPRFY